MSSPTPLMVLMFNDSLGVLRTLQQWFQAHGHRVVTTQLSLMRDVERIAAEMMARHAPTS